MYFSNRKREKKLEIACSGGMFRSKANKASNFFKDGNQVLMTWKCIPVFPLNNMYFNQKLLASKQTPQSNQSCLYIRHCNGFDITTVIASLGLQ